jgi:DNA repair protein RadC
MDPTPFSVPNIIRRTTVRDAPASTALKEVPEDLRPRELLLAKGCAAMHDDQLLAILLRSGVKGCNVVDLARRLLHSFGSLAELAKASPEELIELHLPGLSKVKAVELSAALEIARRVANAPAVTESIQKPETVAKVLRPLVADADHELFLALPLDRKNRLKGRPVQISQGTVDTSLVHPREVFRECVRVSAASVIVAHNHPSGDPTPSAEDVRITKQLVAAGQVLGIPVLDHVVLGNEAILPPGYISLRDKGYLNFSP